MNENCLRLQLYACLLVSSIKLSAPPPHPQVNRVVLLVISFWGTLSVPIRTILHCCCWITYNIPLLLLLIEKNVLAMRFPNSRWGLGIWNDDCLLADRNLFCRKWLLCSMDCMALSCTEDLDQAFLQISVCGGGTHMRSDPLRTNSPSNKCVGAILDFIPLLFI